MSVVRLSKGTTPKQNRRQQNPVDEGLQVRARWTQPTGANVRHTGEQSRAVNPKGQTRGTAVTFFKNGRWDPERSASWSSLGIVRSLSFSPVFLLEYIPGVEWSAHSFLTFPKCPEERFLPSGYSVGTGRERRRDRNLWIPHRGGRRQEPVTADWRVIRSLHPCFHHEAYPLPPTVWLGTTFLTVVAGSFHQSAD